ncbi:MAG: glycosyltransferase [Gemmatimonadetes bacterium]|uniref:Glycosyltransferase n=1 Tax=Candidatus Kutchimonas denitrificans TaxID=3056748 RepID=A0AAE4Z7A8_9BACT|nr:glycosyltransferase [Gemmatimonadota bacterium]NIR75095.1 glycosyltransferase [Candidatus Kutchimonas denitrificans]NIS00927.1 glycosyltransferase [Gemmatimonadota bacterium]NIT66544.1 glycosyltransferase [Gemmatimonadota bacterium]NIU52890.1 glycosyltransferase [Gemmatimonadota bacterium]
MSIVGAAALIGYGLALAGLVIYSLHRGWLLFTYRRKCPRSPDRRQWRGPLPRVTVQLPVYNERFVVERLIDAACALDYPEERLEVQLLDDSTDGTAELARQRVAHHAARGRDVRYLRRGSRAGYKAGALAYGLERASGQFVLVLDADFVPPPKLLRRMLPPFLDPGVGMVQARWAHLNEGKSWLTRTQALLLDAHFHIEHGARAAAGLFFNFNGTGGMWRTSCLRDAGGWQADTLTEDLDLSYRAQMRGWRFEYLPDVVVPGELPEDLDAFKSQQARWAQGSIQTARKLLPALLKGPWGWRVKLEAAAHLTAYVPAALTLALGLTLFPAAVVRLDYGWPLLLFADLFCLVAAIGPLGFFYAETRRASGRHAWPGVLIDVPRILALGIGLSLSNTRALAAGLSTTGDAEFVRTPKRGGTRGGYRSRVSRRVAALEWGLTAYIAVAIGYALAYGLYPSIPFLVLFQFGYAAVAADSLRRPQPVA